VEANVRHARAEIPPALWSELDALGPAPL